MRELTMEEWTALYCADGGMCEYCEGFGRIMGLEKGEVKKTQCSRCYGTGVSPESQTTYEKQLVRDRRNWEKWHGNSK